MSDLRSYHTDQIKSEVEIKKHEDHCDTWHFPFCGNAAHHAVPHKCTCTPVRGTRIVIEVWDDYVVNVKPEDK